MNLLRKTALSLALFASISQAAFANETLSRIVSDVNDKISNEQAMEQLYTALSSGEVSQNDLMDYLKENSSPKAYKKISDAIESGNHIDFKDALKARGANFLAERACSATGIIFSGFAAVAAASFVYSILFVERPNEYDKNKVTQYQASIDSHQADLNELLRAGFSEDHYMVREHRTQIARATIARDEAQANLDGMNSDVEKSKKITKLGFISLGAAASTIIAEELLCN